MTLRCPPAPKQLSAGTPEKFRAYSEEIEKQAFRVLLYRDPEPDLFDQASIDPHVAYAHGLKETRGMTLETIELEGRKRAHSMCRPLTLKRLDMGSTFLPEHEGRSAAQIIEYYYRNSDELPTLWRTDAKLATDISFWLGMNDIYEFAACFINRAEPADDPRHIYPTVTRALENEGLLEHWRAAKAAAQPQKSASLRPLPAGPQNCRFSIPV